MRRFALILGCALSIAAIAPGGAPAKTSTSAFLVFVDPTISKASNGLTLETELAGTFNVADKSASGDGEYAVMSGATVVESGTFTLTRLVALQFYGCGEVEDTPLPPDFCGGRASFRFHSIASTGEERNGLLEVNARSTTRAARRPPGRARASRSTRAASTSISTSRVTTSS